MLAKARDLTASELVIDLEDAVVPQRKVEALEMALAALERGFAAPKVTVRVNPVSSPWSHSELKALASARARPESVIVPKVEDAAELAAVAEQLVGIGVQALIETAAGLRTVHELACAAPAVEALVLGYADLAVSLGRTREGAANLDLWLAVQDAVLVAARARGIRAIDGPFLVIDDEPGLRRSAQRAAELGFDGKWAIHPVQLEPIREAFTPSEEALAHARSVIDALAEAERTGTGALRLDGMMIDEPVRLAALRTLALAGEGQTPP